MEVVHCAILEGTIHSLVSVTLLAMLELTFIEDTMYQIHDLMKFSGSVFFILQMTKPRLREPLPCPSRKSRARI